MNTLPATELKRRGTAALDEKIKDGPIHIIRSNQLAYVILTEQQYESISHHSHLQKTSFSLWDWLEKPAKGSLTRGVLDRRIQHERHSWKRRVK